MTTFRIVTEKVENFKVMKKQNIIRFSTPKKKPDLLQLDKLRHYQVRTKNSLIQNTSFRLTTNQQKIILHLIQKISDKTKSLKFRFNVHDYEEFLGIKPDSRNTLDIKRSLKDLADKSFWIRTKDVDSDHPNDEYDDLVRWFSHVRYNRTRGYFEIQFDNRLKPFLLNIKDNFTSFDYHNVIGMKRSYSIRLYQILVSHYNQQNKRYGYKYSIRQIRFLLGINPRKYKRFADLNRRVIQPSLREMNIKTNFYFFYSLVKDGRKTIGIRILMRKKNKHQQFVTRNNVDKKLLKNVHHSKIPVNKRTVEVGSISDAEKAFKQDVKNAHTSAAKKESIDDRREYLRHKEAVRRRHIQDNKHKLKNYQRYAKKYGSSNFNHK